MAERYPLTWPAGKSRTPADNRRNAQFGQKSEKGGKGNLSVAQATSRLQKELDSYTKIGHDFRIPPDSIIISSNVGTGKKGRPLSGLSEPDDTGVAVYFKLDGQNYCLPCDKWSRVADNIAAIAAHVAAMRGIERWGVGEMNDVYTGFKALPESGTGVKWWDVLGVSILDDLDTINRARKNLLAKYHPDKPTRDETKFFEIENAYRQALAAKSR